MQRDEEHLSVLGPILAGASLGFIAGVLTAPRAGHETRERMARRLEEDRRSLARFGRRKANGAAEALDDRLDSARRSVDDAVSHLKQRLTEARRTVSRQAEA